MYAGRSKNGRNDTGAAAPVTTHAQMTATTIMPLLIREQTAHVTVEIQKGQTASATDAEARALASAIARGDERVFRAL